jgi:hypothetical protein
MTITFIKKKETKGTWLFEEVGDVPSVGTLYVKKHALQSMGWPQELDVTIEAKPHAQS